MPGRVFSLYSCRCAYSLVWVSHPNYANVVRLLLVSFGPLADRLGTSGEEHIMSARSFGSITLESTGRYRARYTGPDGRRHSAGRFATRKAAVRELTRVEDRIDARSWISPKEETRLKEVRRTEAKRREMTVATWADRWLSMGARKWAPRTLRDHRARLRRHVLPVLGERMLETVSAEDVDLWYEDLCVTNSAGVPRPVYMTTRAMFSAAAKARIIEISPVQVEGADRHRPVRSEPRVLSREDAKRLASAMLPRFRLAIWLGLWCGLRRAELVGLQVGDIDLDFRLLHVRRQVVTEEEQGKHRSPGERRKMIFAPPKYGSTRTVGVPAFLAEIVRDHLTIIGKSDHIEARLFPGRCATGTIHPNRLGDAFAKAANDAQLRGFTPHSMRHTALTWAAHAGATTRELMDIAGHRSPEVAMRYQHSTGERQRQIADLMGS